MKFLEISVRIFYAIMILIIIGTVICVCPWLLIILVAINYMIKHENNKKKDNELKQAIIDHIKFKEENTHE